MPSPPLSPSIGDRSCSNDPSCLSPSSSLPCGLHFSPRTFESNCKKKKTKAVFEQKRKIQIYYIIEDYCIVFKH